MNGDKKAWIYSRVAIDDNNELQAQEDMLCRFAHDGGYTIVGKTKESRNSNIFNRLGLQVLEAKTGSYNYLIMRDITRIGRDMIGVREFLASLQEKGITIVTLDGIL